MLVRITECCRMGCNHCMIDATPEGQHMPVETFAKTLAFIKRFDLAMILISGGEPLEHPEFFTIADMVKQSGLPLRLVLSNGMFLEDVALRERVLALGLPFQITNDPRYYPKTVPVIKHPLLDYEHHIRLLSPMGRAVTNNLPADKKAPGCFNLRSVTRTMGTFQQAAWYLRSAGKMCTPSVNIDGAIRVGETNKCFQIGTIDSTDEELVRGILSVKCNKCGLEKNLEAIHRKALGYDT